jgi:hypothetical protein
MGRNSAVGVRLTVTKLLALQKARQQSDLLQLFGHRSTLDIGVLGYIGIF